jgi:lipoprotein signal peptidase
VAAFVAAVVSVFLLDQGIKSIVSREAVVAEGGRLTYRANPYGGLGNVPAAVGAAGLLTAAAFAVAVLILSSWVPLIAVGLGAALGGATSNFADRARRGYVVDYLRVHAGKVVNLGDVAIGAGSLIAVAGLLATL